LKIIAVVNVSVDAEWTSDGPSVAEVVESFDMVIRAVGPGETLVHAVYEDFHGIIKVTVIDETGGDQ
jgi:hypothetical protein